MLIKERPKSRKLENVIGGQNYYDHTRAGRRRKDVYYDKHNA